MSLRIDKINELIKERLSEIIRKEIEFPETCLITITHVKTSPDIKYCRVFITVIPDNLRGTALKILRSQAKNLQGFLRQELVTKFTPNLNFVLDEQELYAQKIDKLLDGIKQD
jgi:ribosome-binding factor A